ncbi:LysR family transcriptional regulator [Vibrio neptunius]|uniref:LysR family transcriptional regulator n=1 Tax=Vibrio neptunius TaxID=170651 RepID=UPI0019D1A02A|nr:LysR family transcriptional regulator [Vibrio neptunius]MBN3574887.1 LysR family transcriptional regulator [Vibrio neptunius]QXX06900.1 LysR family transcriptional regulator [Vibrio neptunius]
MELEDIYRRDLNLLVALRVLIEECSVSKAAHRLNLSQSAMSRVLGRLRDMLGDPLFTRQGQHLIPTEKALEVDKALGEPLESLRQVLSPIQTEPQSFENTFNIATTDYAMQTILPFALPRIYQEAPNVSINFLPLQHDRLADQLTYEGADLAICRPIGPVDPLRSEILGRVGVLCLLSKQHPLANTSLSLKDYLTYPHAMIAISDGVKTLIEQALVDQPKRKMVLRAYHLEAALAIVDTMPLIITVPADLAYLVAERYDLAVKPLPFQFTSFDYSMIWHARCEHSPAQEWLRSVVREECSRLIAKRIADMGLD